MTNRKDKLVLDTNIWISFLISHDYSKLDKLIFKHKVTFVFSEELFLEFIDVSRRPKFIKFFTPADNEQLIRALQNHSIFIPVASKVKKSRDSNDDFLLSLSLDAQADYLITGDKDLLVLKSIGETKIVTMTEYLEMRK